MFTFGRNVGAAGAAAPQRSTAKLMMTGQTTVYRTGDDADNRLTSGRATSFTVLAENNPFGNTNRFTDELGGQTYTNNIVIDWSTYDGSSVLGYRRTATTAGDWNTLIDSCLTVSIGSFTNGWRMININEIQNIMSYGTATNCFNYSVLTTLSSGLYWTSTTDPNSSVNAYYLNTGNLNLVGLDKSTNFLKTIPVRNFTVSGTTLS